ITRDVLESYLTKIVGGSAFKRMELDERRSYKEGIPKAHYKFIYDSNYANRDKNGNANSEREILLDVLFADHHYPQLVDRPLKTDWLLQDGEILAVSTPDINSITGDKLTAFAPNTTGVLYGVSKEKEIIKQLFDIGCLFDLLTDIEVVKKSFTNSALGEIKYRPERNIASVKQVLLDTIDTAILIAKK